MIDRVPIVLQGISWSRDHGHPLLLLRALDIDVSFAVVADVDEARALSTCSCMRDRTRMRLAGLIAGLLQQSVPRFSTSCFTWMIRDRSGPRSDSPRHEVCIVSTFPEATACSSPRKPVSFRSWQRANSWPSTSAAKRHRHRLIRTCRSRRTSKHFLLDWSGSARWTISQTVRSESKRQLQHPVSSLGYELAPR